MRMPARTKGLLIAGVVAAVGSLAFAIFLMREHRARQSPGAAYVLVAEDDELPVYGELPDFSLTAHTGQEVTSASLHGDVVIANFIFTRCETVCPAFSMKMRRVQERTAGDPSPRLISFSVDPEHDTPEVLAAYAERFSADPARWHFLTGDPAELRRAVTDGLKVAMEREGDTASGAPNIVHGEHFVLLDQRGQIRGYYSSNEQERIEEMLADAASLLAEPPPAAAARAQLGGSPHP
jgi:protein SCO1